MTRLTVNGRPVSISVSADGVPRVRRVGANAIFAATGKRLRSLPINSPLVKQA